MVSTIRVSTHLPPIRAHCGGIVRGRRGRERRAGSCGLGETQNALPGATATDIRRTRTNISTRRSVMRCVPPLGTRPNTRRRMGCARRAGMDEERLRGGRHGMSAISACVFPESSLFYFSPGALHLPHAHQRGREGGIHCGTHLTRLRIDKAQGAQAAQPVRSRLGASTDTASLLQQRRPARSPSLVPC